MSIKLRCPHCDGELKDITHKYCPHCRKELNQEDLMKQSEENDALLKNRQKIRCPICDKEVDECVTSCPFCGHLIDQKYNLPQKHKIPFVGIGIVAVGVIICICIVLKPKENKTDVTPTEVVQSVETQTEYVTETELHTQLDESKKISELQAETHNTVQNHTASATLDELNAVKRALEYLQYSSFSRQGLIDQLIYEGFSYNDAVYGVDNCKADWNLQAIETAESYLKYSSFSKEGLIEQLKHDGFTDDEATYGVDAAYNLSSTNTNTPAGVDAGMSNALDTALSYLNFSAFSYDGLVEQLEHDGYSNSEATYAADNCSANWNEQAAKKAADYLKYSSFSRQELIDQLVYEGFTKEQATYGVTSVGY